MSKIHIVGAGLSGMVAAINLAREGREVLVLEGGKNIGGLKNVHPSAHSTPIDPQKVSRFIGIDICPHFKTIRDLRFGILNKTYRARTDVLHCVERSARPSSVDAFLYEECLRAGVSFSFNTLITDPYDLPPDTILATGLYPEMQEALNIPRTPLHAFWVSAERSSGLFTELKAEFEQLLVGYMYRFSNDYFYITSVNDLWYALLFSRKPLNRTHLAECAQSVQERLGVKLSGWSYRVAAVPTKSAHNSKLFLGDKILAGSLAGAMDPLCLFGIHGALVSGKIAATALSDPQKALEQFKAANRFFKTTLYMRRFYERYPLVPESINVFMKMPRAMAVVSRLMVLGVPGYTPLHPTIHSIQRD